VRLPFTVSNSRATHPFDLIHCDPWTSPIVSVSGYKYYLVILDDCTHYTWTFPLRLKSDTFGVVRQNFVHVYKILFENMLIHVCWEKQSTFTYKF
jgi:hypothetical protein